MDLYTLSPLNFTALNPVDQYVSAIWTERYTSAGDIRIVTAASPKARRLLAEGTYVRRRGTKEVAQILTQSVEKGLLTAVGPMLTKAVLDERQAWFNITPEGFTDLGITNYVDSTRKPGEFISHVVDIMAITSPGDTYGGDAALLWAEEMLPFLSLGPVDTSGVVKRLEAALGPLYSSIQSVAQTEKVGIKLYLESADAVEGYSMKFMTYRGVDRTYDGPGGADALVRLSPNMDTLDDLKELNSIDGYKNVVYVHYKGEVTVHYEDPDNIPEGLDRRVMIHDAEGTPIATGRFTDRSGGVMNSYVRPYVSPEDEAAFREQQARDALANHNHIYMVDGTTQPENGYKFGEDYGLGDLIELQSFAGKISKAQVTEHIWAEDEQGEREYPTISVMATEEVTP